MENILAAQKALNEKGMTFAGRNAPFDPFAGGKSGAPAVFTDVAYGTTGWLDLRVPVPSRQYFVFDPALQGYGF